MAYSFHDWKSWGRFWGDFSSLTCSSSHNIAFGQEGLLANQTRQGKEINEDSYDIFDETHNCLENMAEIDEAHQESILLTIKRLFWANCCSSWSWVITRNLKAINSFYAYC